MAERPSKWLDWARELQALGQTGLHYASNHYERRNYARIQEIAAEMVEQATGLEPCEILERFRVQPGYATVKVDVRAAVVHEGRILLVRERVDGRWALPGGWADVGETPSDMVTREVREESGYLVRPVKLLAAFDANRGGVPLEFYHAYKLIFLCELLGGEPTPSEETSEVGFFDFNELPPLSMNRTNHRHLAEVQAHLLDPTRSPAFD